MWDVSLEEGWLLRPIHHNLGVVCVETFLIISQPIVCFYPLKAAHEDLNMMVIRVILKQVSVTEFKLRRSIWWPRMSNMLYTDVSSSLKERAFVLWKQGFSASFAKRNCQKCLWNIEILCNINNTKKRMFLCLSFQKLVKFYI